MARWSGMQNLFSEVYHKLSLSYILGLLRADSTKLLKSTAQQMKLNTSVPCCKIWIFYSQA